MNRRTALETLFARRAQRGLSLVESCIALAVVGVLAGAAAPSFEASRQKRAIHGSSAGIVADIAFARSEAVARQQGVRLSVRPSADGGACLIMHTGAATDCNCASSAGPQCLGDAKLIKSSLFAATAPVTLSASVASMRFDQDNGSVTPAGTLRVATADGRTLHHVVNMMGRVRTCSTGGAIAGTKSC